MRAGRPTSTRRRPTCRGLGVGLGVIGAGQHQATPGDGRVGARPRRTNSTSAQNFSAIIPQRFQPLTAIAKTFAHLREVLVLIEDIWDGFDGIDIEDVCRGELRERNKLVQQRLRVLVDAAGRDDICNSAGCVGEWHAVGRIVDDDRTPNRPAVDNRGRQQGGEIAGPESRRKNWLPVPCCTLSCVWRVPS